MKMNLTILGCMMCFYAVCQTENRIDGTCWTGDMKDAWGRNQILKVELAKAEIPNNDSTSVKLKHTAKTTIPDFVFAEPFISPMQIADDSIVFTTNYGSAIASILSREEIRGVVVHKTDTLRLTLNQASCPAKPQQIIERPLTIDVGDLSLGGTLYAPKKKAGSFACAIFVHGKKCNERTRFMSRAKKLAEAGMAAFVFDKRGSPPTNFDHIKTTIDQHAKDLARIVEHLSMDPMIDAYRIGLIGYSTGGWVSPLAAQKTRVPISFFITVVGPAISTEVYNKHWFPQMILRKTNSNESAYVSAQKYINLAYSAKPASQKAKEMAAIFQMTQRKGWSGFIPEEYVVKTQNDLPKLWTSRYMYDPALHLSRMKCPILVVLGEEDWVIPTDRNYSAFKKIFLESGKRNFEIVRIPNADHSMKLKQEEKEDIPPEVFTRIAPQSWYRILDFLRKNEFLPQEN